MIYTVKGKRWSAGRIYDNIGKKAKGTAQIVMSDGVHLQVGSEEVMSALYIPLLLCVFDRMIIKLESERDRFQLSVYRKKES